MALDPTFWQSLGKALGWTERSKQTDNLSFYGWHGNALEFTNIILTGGDADQFWHVLLQ